MAIALSTAKRVLFIVAIVSCVAMLIMIGEYYRTGAAAAGQQIGNSVGIIIYMGQYLSQQVSSLTEYHLGCLGTYTVHTPQRRTKARQVLRFNGPGFNGGLLTFKQSSDTGQTSDFLVFPTDQPILEYETIFDSGLVSKINGNTLPDLEEESIRLMGGQFSILDARIDTGSKQVSLKLMGPGGIVMLRDRYDDVNFNQGVEVNGRSVYAQVMIIGSETGQNEFGIYNIKYRPYALNEIDILPRHGLKGTMREPEKLLNPEFNIFYTGLRSGGPSVPIPTPTAAAGTIKISPAGDDKYNIEFTTHERTYKIPLISIRGGGMVWGDQDKNFIFKENNDVNVHDYFMVSSGTGINDRTNILVYDGINFDQNVLYIKDWSGSSREVKFDAGGSGTFIAGGHDYKVRVDMANPSHPIRVDLNGDGSIGSSTVEAVLLDGTRLKFSGSGSITYTVPKRLFEDKASDETASMTISQSGDELNLVVTSPTLISSGSGIKEGMMKYGARFWYDKSREPQKLIIYLPGGQAMGMVSVGGGFGFSTGTGQAESAILVTCEESVLKQKQMQQQAMS